MGGASPSQISAAGHPLVHAGAQSPQTCILGVGATHQTHPGAPSLLPLSLTFDHRAIDGAGAAALAGRYRPLYRDSRCNRGAVTAPNSA